MPSLNPDGVDIVKNWYDKTLGTPYEGTDPPELYHKYTGHDNNRDWYAFTQVETQLTVDKIHNVWHPQIVHDIHQQGAFGSRLFRVDSARHTTGSLACGFPPGWGKGSGPAGAAALGRMS